MTTDSDQALRSAIEGNRVFKGIGEEHLRIVMANGSVECFAENDLIVREGQKDAGLCLIVTGRMEVKLEERVDENGRQRTLPVRLNTLATGDCFGEYSLIDGQPASATVRATQAGTLFRITGSDFASIMASDDRLAKCIYRNLLEVLVQRLRKKDQELDDVLTLA